VLGSLQQDVGAIAGLRRQARRCRATGQHKRA
jgi:hypothetical protein